EVYIAPWFLSYPGNSGGPLYVQFNGYFYPAAIYLGTLYNGSTYSSAVRAIDSDVVRAINVAQGDAGTGNNNTGGAGLTPVPNYLISANNPAYVQVAYGPTNILALGGWRLHGDSSYGTNSATCSSSKCLYSRSVTDTNAFIEFRAIPGWNSPDNQNNQL